MRTTTRMIALFAATACLVTSAALAQEKTLTVLSHRVHENVARGLGAAGAGGDIVADCPALDGVTVNWITADIDPLHDRLQRELALSQSAIDVAFVINKYATPRISRLLEDLGPHMERAPIEDAEGVPADLMKGLTADGKLFGIPYRHATTGMHYNAAHLETRGIEGPPQTIEEVVETARKLTFVDEDGNQVYGLTVPSGSGPFAVLSLLKGFGAEIIDQDLNVTANSPEMVHALTVLRDLYKEGVLPPNYPTLSIDEVITLVQQGRTGLTFDPFARYATFNKADVAKYPDQVLVAPIPARAEEGGIVAMTEIWAMTIPANSPNKDLAWQFIQCLSAPEATVRAAMNGNGPVRPAAYQDTRVQEKLPYWENEADAIANAAMLPSSYDTAAETGEIFMEESQAAILGFKSPEDAAADMQKRIEAQFR